MTNFLLKAGMFLMLIAGIVIVACFFVFAFFSLIIIIPGLLFYKAGIKNLYKEIIKNKDSSSSENMKIIDVYPEAQSGKFIESGKNIAKKLLKKIRDFINKYVD
jgi:hypothetical protein